MIMDVKEKTKDNIKARMDILLFCNRKNMELSFDGSRVAKPKAFSVCKTIGFIFFLLIELTINNGITDKHYTDRRISLVN
jgi:hypothetical protein